MRSPMLRRKGDGNPAGGTASELLNGTNYKTLMPDARRQQDVAGAL